MSYLKTCIRLHSSGMPVDIFSSQTCWYGLSSSAIQHKVLADCGVDGHKKAQNFDLQNVSSTAIAHPTSKATPHMDSSHSGPAAVASWKPDATPDSTACMAAASTPGSRASAVDPAHAV